MILSADKIESGQKQIDQALTELRGTPASAGDFSWAQRERLLAELVETVEAQARSWAEAACAAKRIPASSTSRAEEVIGGPLSVMRYLQLMRQTAADIIQTGRPRLPGRPYRGESGNWRVPIFPTKKNYDSVVFSGLSAEAWMAPSSDPEHPWADVPQAVPRLTLVLGAGNVSAIPATDSLTKIFQEGRRVLLKMNPVNSYLTPIFLRAFAPLIEGGWLRIIEGDAAAGRYALNHSGVDEVHITGSTETHQAIVWGSDRAERERRISTQTPQLSKPITSELGNVSPWIVVPGHYTRSQLEFQAATLAASITNNASFNCLSTKVIVTCRNWPQRDEFLGLIEAALQATPRRHAYYPGARERWERFAGETAPADLNLPWKLMRDAEPSRAPHLFQEESFVCVCVETSWTSESPKRFLDEAVAFVNEQCQGTLCVALTVPAEFSRQWGGALQEALAQLRYGSIGVNQWPGLIYALMTPPWGGYPGATLADPQSGIGSVHNTYLLRGVEKTVLWGPLRLFPKPIWIATHKHPERVAWGLFDLYCRPSLARFLPLLVAAVRG